MRCCWLWFYWSYFSEHKLTRIPSTGLFSFEEGRNGEAKIANERHYVLVEPNHISKEDLENYRKLAGRTSG